MKARNRDDGQAPELTTTEARQGGRQTSTFVVLVVTLALLTVVGLAFLGVRF